MQKYRRSDILNLLKKETGANPVRARRREAQNYCFSTHTPQCEDKPLGNREGEKQGAAVGIFFKLHPTGLIKP